MNFFTKLFSQNEDSILELWRRIKAMDEETIKDVATYKATETSGQLAFVQLYIRMQDDIIREFEEEGDGYFTHMQSGLRALYKNDAILLADHAELKKIRKVIKEIIDK
ncbi:MAG TPA: hypothetical protein DIC26_13245 [Pseudomonas sp.]|nr:hypothetical protein [Pseudomonas sp.]